MRQLRHGYTNHTVGDGTTVVKRYEGPDAAARLHRERWLLTRLHGLVPVPPLLGSDGRTLELGFMPGTPGQELMESGHAAETMRACGTVLRQIHAVPPPPGSPPGSVVVHGDFGPNNLLIDPETFAVTAVVDWEFAHVGARVTDLAWCEWIVRMHHPEHVGALEHCFTAYGPPAPDWPERHAAMIARCVELRDFCERWEPGGPSVRQWEERTAATRAWTEAGGA
jgi:aminoglycoside phosphotransferase (APT) family kinase protein